MSLNKGKAKAKPSKKTTAKTAGTKKKAVMNRRKYNEAISGDTMSNYAMYKSGGSFPDLTGDGKVTRADVLKGRGVFKKGGATKKKKKY